MTLAQGLFMAEAEGYLDTREEKLRKIARDVASYPQETIPMSAFSEIVEHYGIRYETLTNGELQFIQNAIKG